MGNSVSSCCSDCCPNCCSDCNASCCSDCRKESIAKEDKVDPAILPAEKNNTIHRKLLPCGFFLRNILDLINGYESSELCLIERALANFNDRIKEQIVEARKQYQSRTVENIDPLSEDEWLAIYVFSMANDNWLRSEFDKDIRSENKLSIQRWFKYLRLLKSGLAKMSFKKMNVIQIVYVDDDLNDIITTQWTESFTGIFTSPGAMEESDLSMVSQKNQTLYIVIEYMDVIAFDIFKITNDPQVRFLVWAGRKMVRKKVPETNSQVQTVDKPTDELDDIFSIYPGFKALCEKNPDGLLVVRLTAVYETVAVLNPDPITEVDPMPDPVPELIIDPPEPQLGSSRPGGSSRAPRNPRIAPLPPPVSISPTQINFTEHFSCPKKYCQRKCEVDHPPGHCRGFSLVFHECKHHCGPKFFDNSLLTRHLYKRIKLHTFYKR